MSSRPRLTRIGRALAAAAGILSVVFVGMEVRQNTKAVRGATYQAVAEANTDWLAMLATQPELGNLLQRWSTGDTTLTEREVGTVYTLQLLFWRTVENAHYQYLQGSLPEEVVRRWIPPDMLENPVLRDWWAGSRDRFTPAFVEYVEAVVREQGTP